MIRRPPRSTHYPNATLFRSADEARGVAEKRAQEAGFADLAEAAGALLDRGRAAALARRVEAHDAARALVAATLAERSEEHTSELQSRQYLVCRLLLEKNKTS